MYFFNCVVNQPTNSWPGAGGAAPGFRRKAPSQIKRASWLHLGPLRGALCCLMVGSSLHPRIRSGAGFILLLACSWHSSIYEAQTNTCVTCVTKENINHGEPAGSADTWLLGFVFGVRCEGLGSHVCTTERWVCVVCLARKGNMPCTHATINTLFSPLADVQPSGVMAVPQGHLFQTQTSDLT